MDPGADPELCLLKFDKNQQVFAPNKPLGVKKVKSGSPESFFGPLENGAKETSKIPLCNCDTSVVVPFVGDPIHSKICVSLKALSHQTYMTTSAVLDSGSEVNVIIDEFFKVNSLDWDYRLDQSGPHQKISFSGPSGGHLTFKGDLKIWVKIQDRTELIPFVVLKGDSPTIILGNPGMKLFNICVKPGVHATINVRQCKEIKHQVAAGCESHLPPWAFPVKPLANCQVPRFSQRWLTFHPVVDKSEQHKLETYEYQQFLFRNCNCVLQSDEECEECCRRGEEPPFQLSRLEKGQFQICFLNTQNFDWFVDVSAPYTVEFSPMSISRSSIAKDLLVSFEHFSPQLPLTEREAQADFEHQYEHLKGQLAEIVCEPQGFSCEGFHGPTLQIFPRQPAPTFSQKSMFLKDYVKTNPCAACNLKKLSSCDPQVIGCISRQLYEDELPKEPLCCIVEHEKIFPINIKCKRKCLQIWAIRPNLPVLNETLNSRYSGYKTNCEQVQGEGGTNVVTQFVRLASAPVILRSTEALGKVAKWCRSNEYFEIFFPNFEQFYISKYRGRRIFHDHPFRLHFYAKNPELNIVDNSYVEKNNPSYQSSSLSFPTTEQVLHGLPPPITNPDLREAESRAVESGVVEELILCNSEKVKTDTISLLNSHPALWAKSSYDVGLFRHRDTGEPVRFDLKMKYVEPVITPPRFVSAPKQAAAKAVLAGLLKLGVVKSQYSRNRLNAVYVPKKMQPITKEEWSKMGRRPEEWRPGMAHPNRPLTLRLTLDFSPINKQLADIPMIPSDPRNILTAIQDNRLLSVADVSLSFNSLLLSRASQDLCGFSPGIRGVPPLVFSRVVMGAKSSSQLLQLSMNHALQGCLDYTFVLADDIVVLADTEEMMLTRLAKVFQCLENCGFVLKREKLALYVGSKNPSIQLFGLNINLTEKKCSPVAKKVDEILTRPLPSTISGIRSLNGMLAWQAGFLQGGPDHHATLHAMTRAKEGQYDLSWTEERLVAIEFFLDKLSSPDCMLHLPDPLKTMYICSDASLKACGYYLYQLAENERPMVVAYQARVFTERQSKYSAFEREAISALFALISFWNYVEGRKTVLITDSTTSFYINFFSKVNSKVARYRIFLQSLDWLEICWKAGNSLPLRVSDYLSRRSQCPKQKVNQQVTDRDCVLASKVASKLKREFMYSMDQSSHIIDYVLELTEDQLEKLPKESVYMDSDGVVKVDTSKELDHPHAYDFQLHRLKQKQEQEQKQEQGVQGDARQGETQRDQLGEGAPDRQKDEQGWSQLEESAGAQVPLNQCALPGDQTSTLGNIQHLSIKNVLNIKKEEEKCKNWKKERGGQSTAKASEAHSVGQGIAEALNEQSLDAEALAMIYSPSEAYFRPPSEIPPPEGSTRIEKFLYVVQKESPGVRFSELRKAQQEDPHLDKIIKNCEQEDSKAFSFDKRTNYFLGGSNNILCREVKDPLTNGTRLQICVPLHWAFDLAIMAHRSARLSGGPGRGQGPHFAAEKLAKLLSRRFYFRHMLRILQTISRTCQICLEIKPGIRSRPNFFRRALLVSRPAQGWYIDAVKLSSVPNEWNFTTVLTIVCAYSHWLIVAPVKQPLNQQYTVELLYSYVFNYFNLPDFLMVDNASVFCGSLIRDVCVYLNISLNSTARYQPRGNISELLNRFLISALSIQKENFTLSNKSWNLGLMHAVTNINYSPYRRTQYDDSPAKRFLGDSDLLKNASLIGTCFDQIFELFPSADERAKEARKVSNALTNLRNLHARQRQQELSKNACRKQFEVGDIVTCRYRAVPSKSGAHKLQKRFRFLFTIVYCQGSTAYLRPYSLGALERYLKFTDQAHRAPLPTLSLPTFKVAISDLKRVEGGLQLYSNNSRKCHFSEFSMPEPPQPLNVNLYTPVDSWPIIIGEESNKDKYSDYTSDGEEDTLDGSQMSREQRIKENGQRTYFMDESGRWFDSESGALDEEPWLVQGGRSPVGVDPGPGAVQPQPVGLHVPQPDERDDVGLLREDRAVAGDPLMLEKGSPQSVRRSCRKKKVPWRLQQVGRRSVDRTTSGQGNLPFDNFEEKLECLNVVKSFFDKSSSMSIHPTMRAYNYYENLFEHLDEKALSGDAQKAKNSCDCLECLYGTNTSPCLTNPCRLCKL